MTLLLLIVTFCIFAAAQEGVYFGCYRYPEAIQDKTVVWLEDYGPTCSAYCFDQIGTVYSYQFAQYRGGPGIDEWCACSDDSPRLVYETGNQRTCDAGASSPSDVAVQVNDPNWIYLGCYDFEGPAGYITDEAWTPCNSLCGDHRYMLHTFTDSGSDICACVDDNHLWAGLPRSNCAHLTDQYVYERINRPSAVVRREARVEAERIARESSRSLCPSGIAACNIVDSEGLSYECLDTQRELESCGGCLHGGFKPHDQGSVVSIVKQGVEYVATLSHQPDS
ncbi:hypothetical protein I316_02812 [Kwoniella heveanensis BCC8398]|uniref:WSC domain-containing protein n=1 Tax=Kwoniella heveanensis BCC8398 TaxID=1296120 RepID=A0A1B9GW63_9TREE|nr:hypothetical protein I316_02812 [Kwoniella heveanensis BCC8398]